MSHVEHATVQVVNDGTAASCLTIAVFYYCSSSCVSTLNTSNITQPFPVRFNVNLNATVIKK